jgi:glucose/arabinose dehydrogenase
MGNLDRPMLYISLLVLLNILAITGCKKIEDEVQSNPEKTNLAATGNSPGLQTVVEGLVSPVTLVEAPDSTKRLFVVDQIGKIWIIDSAGKKMQDPFIDLSSRIVTLMSQYDERGLLGLAFDPKYKDNCRFFVFYTAPPRPGGPAAGESWNNLTKISQFTVSSSNPNQADIGSEKIILQSNHPQFNHNGGTIAFGPDGYLYISIGDGGNSDDVGPGHVIDWYKVNEGGNGQDVCSNLLGNILRIDVSSGEGYKIPSDNPFMNNPKPKHEVYAYGFRNPYRFSFDIGGSHELIVGDAGQSLYEEINLVTKGGNYGWNVREGRHCFSTANNLVELGSCPLVDNFGTKLTDPVIELPNAANPKGGVATVIVAGHVYRGSEIPEFQGRYIFGIFSQGGSDTPDGKLYISTPTGNRIWSFNDLPLKNHADDIGQYLKGFGQGLDGEIYVLVSGEQGPMGTTGKVLKLAMVP